MTEITSSQLHKTVRNIMLNDLGLTKKNIEDELRSNIREIAEKTAERIINERMLKDGFLIDLAKCAIMKIMNEGKIYRRYEFTTVDFDEYLNQIMTSTFKEMLKDRFELNIKEKKHD